MKRAFDILLGIPIAILAGPILVVVGLLIVVTSGWPAFIVQTRVGANERPIRVPKLRTMHVGVPLVAKAALRPEDAKYTPLGPWLRRSSLDELPQIVSVLRGDMSLVGPRPALPSQHDLLALRRRHGVIPLKPGLTGLAQIEGRESLTLPTKVRYEALYARRQSFWFDLAIVLKTGRAVFGARGAY
ncbi:MAG TPA: sugar transferase [Candidatus Limnocylindria bacterium]|nr:sugar transferase [Candidatus Limnocylindria bacterium]